MYWFNAFIIFILSLFRVHVYKVVLCYGNPSKWKNFVYFSNMFSCLYHYRLLVLALVFWAGSLKLDIHIDLLTFEQKKSSGRRRGSSEVSSRERYVHIFIAVCTYTFRINISSWATTMNKHKKNRRYHKSPNKKEVTVILKLPFGKCFNVNIPLWMAACHDSYVW